MQTRPIDGNGAGLALIIDDPEERTNLVSEILKAASLALRNGETFGRIVRIILISRESRDAWSAILNEPATFIDEIKLDRNPHLAIEDALAIAGDIAIEYPARLNRAASDFSGVEPWLERDAVHRLPLNVVAASVHAVLDPGRAFKLDGSQILTTLADWELRRVRYYSKRNLGDRDALEKLLGLSVLTRLGLTKQAVFDLGEKGICPEKSGDGLLEAIQQTPYWRKSSPENPSHLTKLEPDRAAAIFCLKALRLDDPSPGLPRWLVPAAIQDVDGFGERLNRVSFDIGHVDPTASQNIEQQCIAMLDMQPALITQFRGIAESYLPVFSAAFAIEICQRLLTTDDGLNDDSRATIANSLANMLSDLGQHQAAAEASKTVVLISRRLAASGSPAFLAKLATSLNNQSCILAELHDREAALQAINEAVSIRRRLASASQGFASDLAIALSNQGNRLSDLARHDQALAAINESVSINRHLANAGSDVALNRLAGALNNQANRLANVGDHEAALKAALEAVAIHRGLAEARPDVYLQNLALTLSAQGQHLFTLRQHDAAFEVIEEAISIRWQLATLRPDAFLLDLALTLNNTAHMLADVGQAQAAMGIISEALGEFGPKAGARTHAFLETLAGSLGYLAHKLGQPAAALSALSMAVSVYQQLASAYPDKILPALAKARNQQANRLSDVGEHQAALEAITEAVSIFRHLATVKPKVFQTDIATSLVNRADTLASLERHEEALEAIDEAVAVLRHLAKEMPEIILPDLAKALNNQADTLTLLGKHEAAIHAIEEAIVISQDGNIAPSSVAIWTHTKAHILLRAERFPESLAASTEAITTLRTYFLADPRSHPVMVNMVRLYAHVCAQASMERDMELLQPILDRFKPM